MNFLSGGERAFHVTVLVVARGPQSRFCCSTYSKDIACQVLSISSSKNPVVKKYRQNNKKQQIQQQNQEEKKHSIFVAGPNGKRVSNALELEILEVECALGATRSTCEPCMQRHVHVQVHRNTKRHGHRHRRRRTLPHLHSLGAQ